MLYALENIVMVSHDKITITICFSLEDMNFGEPLNRIYKINVNYISGVGILQPSNRFGNVTSLFIKKKKT